MKIAAYAIVLVCSLAAFPAVAQVSPAIQPDKFVDIERDEALISTPHWLRGLHFASVTSALRPRLLVLVPDSWAGRTICANATTIDGRYLVASEYRLPDEIGEGMTELAYPTRFPDIWGNSSMGNSGVVLSQGACDGAADTGQSTNVLPVVLNGQAELEPDNQGRPIMVMNLNARNTQEVIAILAVGNSEIPARCDRIDRSDAVEFNFTCKFALPVNISGSGELRVTRLNNGRRALLLTADIVLPSLE